MKKREMREEVKGFTLEELKEKLQAEKVELTTLKMNHAVTPIDNPMKINHKRKYIARLQTELTNRLAQ